jgi:hypothetical protein
VNECNLTSNLLLRIPASSSTVEMLTIVIKDPRYNLNQAVLLQVEGEFKIARYIKDIEFLNSAYSFSFKV